MTMRSPVGGIVGLCVLIAAAMSPVHGQDRAIASEPKYLLFQLFTAGPGFTTEEGTHVLSKLPEPDFLDRQAKNIVERVGSRGDRLHRLGVMVGPLALDYTDAQLRELVDRTFKIAAKHKIAVGLHIDDSKFWINRRDLWSNPANVEWLDWQGTPNKGQYLNWGEPWKLAPQACFNSPAVIQEAKRLARDVIGPAVATQLAKLRDTGDEALFAGIIVGWETAIGQDFDTRRDLGYCALSNRGFTQKSPPADADLVIESVISEWISTWSGSLAGAGIPADKLYSHIAFTSRRQYRDSRRQPGKSYSRSVLYTPPAVAFGTAHRAGFTTYPDADILEDIQAALASRGNPPWASAEGTNVNIHAGPFRSAQQSMESYLARMFNRGAMMTNLFGWGIGNRNNLFRQATEREEALVAYRKFLGGSNLIDASSGKAAGRDSTSNLQDLMRALPARIEEFQRNGGDPRAVQPWIEQLERNVQQGRLDAARQDLEAISQVFESHAARRGAADAEEKSTLALLQERMRALPQRIDLYQRRGGNMSRIQSRVADVQKHIAKGELEKAFTELLALDPILDSR